MPHKSKLLLTLLFLSSVAFAEEKDSTYTFTSAQTQVLVNLLLESRNQAQLQFQKTNDILTEVQKQDDKVKEDKEKASEKKPN